MDEKLKPLFTPWRIGNCEIKNRIVLTSMGGTDLFGWMEKNHFDKMGARFLMEAAKNNAGLVLPGCQPVYNPMFGQWLYKNKKMYEDLKEWMPEFHKTGAKLFVQLTAGFGRSFTTLRILVPRPPASNIACIFLSSCICRKECYTPKYPFTNSYVCSNPLMWVLSVPWEA